MSIIIFGFHPVCEALKKRPGALHRILMTKQAGEAHAKKIVYPAKSAGVKTYYETAKNLSRFAGSEQHQSIVAEIEPFPLLDLKDIISSHIAGDKKVFFLVMDSVQDPRNFGSLIRSALCSGVQAVIFPKDRSAGLTGTVAKSSAGAIEHMPMCRVVNIAASLEIMKKAGIWVVGTSPHSRDSIYRFDFNLDMALVIGSEEKGIRPLVLKKCDFCLSIPLKSPLNSLNASVAGAVVLFEAMRQRN